MDREIEVAWAAGFIDGEGSFLAGIDGRGYRWVVLSVTQTDTRPLERLQAIFGGTIATRRCVAPRKQSWLWRVWKFEDFVAIVRELGPYLLRT